MRILLALVALVLASVVHAAPVVVQTSSVGAFSQGASADDTATVTLTGVASGNSLIVGYWGGGNNGASPAVSCSDGSAFTQAVTRSDYIGPGSQYRIVSVHHRHNVAAGTHPIVCTHSSGAYAAYGHIIAVEVSGLANAAADATNTNGGTSTNPTSGSATPTTASSIAFAAVSLNDFTNPVTFGNPPSGYTSVAANTNGELGPGTGGAVDRKTLTTTAAENPSWSASSGDAWTAAIAIYKAGAASDSTPDAFSFTDQNDVATSSTITSAAITVAGIDTTSTITVSGGTYDINASGSFTGSSGSVSNGDTVRARHTSSGSNSTGTNTVVTIGGVSDTFTSTTVGAGGGGGSVSGVRHGARFGTPGVIR